jgi:molybdate transport system substrate-binding protein
VLLSAPAVAQEKILVAAASDLKFALDSVISAFKTTNGGLVEVVYGSSGKFHEQILNGAPFDIFLSADITYPMQLKNAKLTSSDIYEYGKGRIVLWSKKIDPNNDGMQTLTHATIKKVAIANPMHAPYGKRAVESLAYFKLSNAVKSKLVYGENISQTAQFIATGAADIGIIALSLARSPNMIKENGQYYLIPESSHQPLIQGAIITSHGKGNNLAAAFFEFLKHDQAGVILKHFGFSKP